MENRNTAFFAERPRRYLDLFLPHFLGREQDFIIAKHIILDDIDYENFITDMLVEREYIENAAPCAVSVDGVYSCLFISRRLCYKGVLVVPDADGRIHKAAFYESKKLPLTNIFHELVKLYYARQNLPLCDNARARLDNLQLL